MKRTVITVATILVMTTAAWADPPIPSCDHDEQRVFADVPATSGFCPFVEELWRRRGTVGCRVDQDGTRWFCPGGAFTREQGAAFAVRAWPPSGSQFGSGGDPFVRVSAYGEAQFGSGVVGVEKQGEGSGTYRVEFDRSVLQCIIIAQTGDTAPGISLEARVLTPDISAVWVYASQDGQPRDTTFDLVLRCT